MVTTSQIGRRDRGGVLVITLVLTVVLAVIVLALANFVTVALRTSDVASERTESKADASAVVSWAIEEFAKKQLTPNVACGDAPTFATISGVPSGLSGNGSTTILECRQTTPINNNAAIHLRATSSGEQVRTVDATVLVPLYSHGATVADWRVDIPIEVPDYSTTTTMPSSTTTTTAATNQPPLASHTTWTLLPDSVSPQSVIASDPDGSVVSVVFETLPLPGNVVATSTGGVSFDVTTDSTTGTYPPVRFRVIDDAGAASEWVELTIIVDGTTPTSTTEPPTTTTTLAPNLTCTFTVTNAAADEKSGIAQLKVTNSGGTASGWRATIGWPPQWNATWPEGLGVTTVNISPNSQEKVVVGGDTVAQSASIDYSVALTWNAGNPKIVLNSTRPCGAGAP